MRTDPAVAMRIHLICAAFPPFGRGGGPVGSQLIARALVASGHEVEVLIASERPYEADSDGYRVRSLGSPNIYVDYWRENPTWKKIVWHVLENFNPVAFFKVSRRIKQFRPDLVMTVSVENINVATWVAAKIHGLPVVHIIQSLFVLCWRGAMYRHGKGCERYCLSCRATSLGRRLAARCVDAVVAETNFLIESHTKYSVFARAKRYLVPGPIDRIDLAEARALIAARNDRVLTVGYIGDISVGKGVLTLARAAQRIHPQLSDRIRFRIAGNGDESFLTSFKAQFPEKSAEFVGWTVASQFYRSVHVVVVPSLLKEAYGRTSVEPLAYGVPVVVARSGGLPENIEPGVSGLIFPADDDEELARLLCRLAQDRAYLRALSEGALERADRYDFAKFCTALDGVVRQVAQRTPASG